MFESSAGDLDATSSCRISDLRSKKIKDEQEHAQFVQLFSNANLQCRSSLIILKGAMKNESNVLVLNHLEKLEKLLSSDFTEDINFLYEIVGTYDYRALRANGIRSYLLLTFRCLSAIMMHLNALSSYSLSNWSGFTHRSLIAYINCLGELRQCIGLLRHFPRFSAKGCLFPKPFYTNLPEIGSCDLSAASVLQFSPPDCASTDSQPFEDDYVEFQNLQTHFDNIKQEYFFGRCVAFYMCPSAQNILQFLTSFMAGYGASFLSSKRGLPHLLSTVFRSVTSYLSPEQRGSMIAKLTRNASVEFCKAFWNLADHRLVYGGPNVILPAMAIVHSFELTPRKLRVPIRSKEEDSSGVSFELEQEQETSEFVCINSPVAHLGPAPVEVRVLSSRLRPGLDWARPDLLTSLLQSANLTRRPTDFGSASSLAELDATSNGGQSTLRAHRNSASEPVVEQALDEAEPPAGTKIWKSKSSKPSPYLLFHIHGGGFVALKSQSQDIFLRIWADRLDCPILSVDYSLAPGAPYPRALEECLFAYSWVVLNRPRLGATADAKIVLCGDSAGGNLALGLCLRIAHLQMAERPAGALIAYAPIIISFAPSPSRMLSLCDPLLSTGMVSRCLLAYAGVDERLLNCDGSSEESPTRSEKRHTSLTTDSSWSKVMSSVWWSTQRNKEQSAVQADANSSAKPLDHSREVLSVPTGLSLLAEDFDQNGSDQSAPNPARCQFNLLDSDSDATPVSTGSDSAQTSPGRVKRLPKSDLDRVREIKFPQDPFMSPYLAPDHLLKELPPLGIVVSNFDPFLDDCIELAKRADSLNVPVDIRVLDDLPHAFLNFAVLGTEFKQANDVCVDMLRGLLDGNPRS